MSKYRVVAGDWASLKPDASYIREQVFILEQEIDPTDEWDEQDPISVHFVVYAQGNSEGQSQHQDSNQGQAIATARLLKDDHVGRVAVLKSHRGQGIGKVVMREIIQYAKTEQRSQLVLSAQVHAIEFYRGLGFEVQGETYLDCNIPHVDMTMSL